MIAGSLIKLLPIDTRCCCPPDNSFGKCFILSSNPKVLIISCSRFSSTFLPSNNTGKDIFSSTFKIGRFY